MAKPPIIISNGGVAEELARGLEPAAGEKGEAWEIIMRNVKKLNKKATDKEPVFPVAKRLGGGPLDPGIIWRLSNENKHPQETGVDAQ